MSYQVEWEQEARESLHKLDLSVTQRILLKVDWLSANIENIKPEALKGPLGGYFKLYVGDYRVIYSVIRTKKVIAIRIVGHRRNVYKLR